MAGMRMADHIVTIGRISYPSSILRSPEFGASSANTRVFFHIFNTLTNHTNYEDQCIHPTPSRPPDLPMFATGNYENAQFSNGYHVRNGVGASCIPHTFDLRSNISNEDEELAPDELMIDWGQTAIGSTASCFLLAWDERFDCHRTSRPNSTTPTNSLQRTPILSNSPLGTDRLRPL
jgi:hypothetical protein